MAHGTSERNGPVNALHRQHSNRDIVLGIAGRTPGFEYDPEQLLYLADRWEIRHGGVSGRTAQQFINYMAGKKEE